MDLDFSVTAETEYSDPWSEARDKRCYRPCDLSTSRDAACQAKGHWRCYGGQPLRRRLGSLLRRRLIVWQLEVVKDVV